MSRFTSLGSTIVVELCAMTSCFVCALWICVVWLLYSGLMPAEASWMSKCRGVVFGAALIFILMSQRIDLRRFGVIESIAARWDRLVTGVTSVLRGNAATDRC
jgi:hypothetical protein